jgi:hypothetical protein
MNRTILLGITLLTLAPATPALAQKPGTPNGGSALVKLSEPLASGAPGTLTPYVRVTAPTLVKDGYLILLAVHINALDPSTWRSVIVFSGTKPECASYGYSNTVTLVSRAAGETGISNADLTRLVAPYSPQITTDSIVALMSTGCVSILTNQPSGLNVYMASGAEYDIQTNPDQVTPASATSWGQLKIIYR